jgi:hypothetical protein
MSAEGLPLQIDMFTGEQVDNRNAYQKKKDRERTAPQQTQMFSTPDVMQFGVRPKSAYRDWLEKAKVPDLELVLVDTRTPEEVERDLIREAEKQTLSLFSDTQISQEIDEAETEPPATTTVLFSADLHAKKHGLRAYLRNQSAQVRTWR